MVERNTQIDIVIPFYNDSDEVWKNVLYDYMAKERTDDRQVTGEERYRDWENLKYWFRCIEENCKWVNKVFLIVASESQIPYWLNRNNPKLRIVLHKEYIPKELLPTFNVMTIENYFCKIKDLSNNYVYCNDDYFFLNPTTEDMFFRNNLPVYKDDGEEIKKFNTDGVDGTFYQILNNGIDLQLEINGDKSKWYSLEHLPVPHKKDFENEILDTYYDKFINANNKSRFRNKNNLSNHVYLCLYRDTKPYYKFNSYSNSCYMSIRKDTDFNRYKDYDMVCFNDTQLLSPKDFITTKNNMLKFLKNKLPNKSLFEKEGGIEMMMLEVIEEFTLRDFDKLKNIERKGEDTAGRLFVGDKFECDEKMADYLTGNNPLERPVAKVIGVTPKEEPVVEEPKAEPKPKVTRKRSKK